MQAWYSQSLFPLNSNVAEISLKIKMSWMSPPCKKKSGTQEMKLVFVNVDAQKYPLYVFPKLEKHGQTKSTQFQGNFFL